MQVESGGTPAAGVFVSATAQALAAVSSGAQAASLVACSTSTFVGTLLAATAGVGSHESSSDSSRDVLGSV
eukprot:5997364-Pleurochrysis_carterae.AAC.1